MNISIDGKENEDGTYIGTCTELHSLHHVQLYWVSVMDKYRRSPNCGAWVRRWWNQQDAELNLGINLTFIQSTWDAAFQVAIVHGNLESSHCLKS